MGWTARAGAVRDGLRRAAATVTEALALIDKNPDFRTARDSDPLWPADDEADHKPPN
ncbi:hypothetical protein [Streptomyces agglomeratus]|uniref:hypothetical protein n=1 Tax=Streptomyces agglomeratus TaxID=285458 RepID=UPI00159F285C|nr:hypothetical protein [Streptomyces agglomeratus]